MNQTSSKAAPRGRPRTAETGGETKAVGNGQLPFDWSVLVPRFVHPLKVATIEALAYIGEPMSSSDLSRAFGDESDVSSIAYHVGEMAKAGALVKVSEEAVRGAVKKSYFFPPSVTR